MRTPTIVSPRRRGRCWARTLRTCPAASTKTVSKSVGSPPSAARRKCASTFWCTSGGSSSVRRRPSSWAFENPQARGHYEAVDQPHVDLVQRVGSGHAARLKAHRILDTPLPRRQRYPEEPTL